jgi:choline-sulfatase
MMDAGARSARYRQVVVLCSDEHDPRHSGFGGSAVARTPNLDRLAAQSLRFERCWTPSPICVPARASLATGRWVHRHRCWDNALAYDGSVPSWHHRLRAHGARVESVGKLHFRSAADDTGFSAQHEPMHLAEGVGQVWGSVRDPLPERGGGAGLFRQMGAGESDYNRYDRRVAARAVAWIEERAAECRAAAAAGAAPSPAALFVGLVAPHFPLVVPQPYLDRVPLHALGPAKLRPETGYRRHPWVERLARYNDLDGQLGSDERRRLATVCYLALVNFLDEQSGRIVDALDASGLAGDTLLVYTSDHGDNLGARGLWNKSVLYRESTAVPLLLRGRGLAPGVERSPASLVDLYPTVLQALGVPPSPDDPPEGRSWLTLARAPEPQRAVLSEYHAIGSPSGGFMLASGDWKLHAYVGHPPELFHLGDDPEELDDLAASPAHAPVLQQLMARLRGIVEPELADRAAKDDQNALVARHGGPEAALRVGQFGATPAPRTATPEIAR